MISSLEIVQIPALSDNYIHILFFKGSAIAIDPGDAYSVIREIKKRNYPLNTILVSHHHYDHTGGIDKLKNEHGCTVFGGDNSRIPGLDAAVHHKEVFECCGIQIISYHVPGHTQSDMAYYLPDHDICFTGDTLFAGGCGRLFEGTADQMWQSLKILMHLPDETKIYCGHEYTIENLRFAHSLEPGNAKVYQRLEHSIALQKFNRSTLPTSLGLEKETNPFLRVGDSALRRSLGMNDSSDEAVFADIRRKKDKF
ncbi:MAG: hydroxyacylglutathione hydrolase [Chitinivibrionales bacterium]|nr:hydroxyacylglutathione hydrolase [Chitinivibrionales bacterium]